MLTKEAKQRAEAIRENVADILGACSLMAKVWEKKGEAYREARALWEVWQYKGESKLHDCGALSATTREEETKKAKKAREESPREWAQRVEELSKQTEAARVALYVARVNFINYINYCAESIAELVRPFWRLVALRKGAEDLGQLLTPNYNEKDKDTAHAFRLHFKISGGNVGAQLFPSSFVRFNVMICPRGVACGIVGSVEGVYFGGDVPDIPQEKKAPHLLTVAEFHKVSARLEEIKKQARQTLDKLTTEARELVRDSGLYGFAEFLASYSLNITK